MIKIFSKITPSLFTIKEGSTSHPSPLQWSLHPLRFPRLRGTETSEERDVTALRCSEPLRYKDGGASKPSPGYLSAGASKVSPGCLSASASKVSPCGAGWDRLGIGGILRVVCVKIIQEVWRCEGKNVFLRSNSF